MATITINPNGDVIVDGVNNGHFLDFHHTDAQPRPDSMPADHPGRASHHADLKAAWDQWHTAQRTLVQDNTNAMNEQMNRISSQAHDQVTKIRADATLIISQLQTQLQQLSAAANGQKSASDAAGRERVSELNGG